MGSVSGYDLYLVELYAGPHLRYERWRKSWDLTEEQDYEQGISE